MTAPEKLAAAYAAGVLVGGIARDVAAYAGPGRVVSGAGPAGPFHGPLVRAETLPGDVVRLWVRNRRGDDTPHEVPGETSVIAHSVGYGERRQGQSNERNR